MKRSSLFASAAVSAAALTAAASVLRRLLHNGVVEKALHQALPVTPVPRDSVTATAAQTPAETDSGPEDPAAGGGGSAGLPSRTWLVDNSEDWDGSPVELVVPPGTGPQATEPGDPMP